MKVLVHAHTTFSDDGELSPRELALLARQHGFEAVLIADHFESLTAEKFRQLLQECRRIEECLMIPGYERNWGGYHVLALGLDRWVDDPGLVDWAERLRALGALTVLAHPGRYRHRVPPQTLEICEAVEVWNSKRIYDGAAGPNPRSYRLLGEKRFPLCGQDLHGLRHATSVCVELARRCSTSQEVLRSLRTTDYVMRNRFFRYGRCLSAAASLALSFFHMVRGFAIRRGLWVRRAIEWAIAA